MDSELDKAFRLFASLGGRSRTPRKSAASRENGKRGGRPKGSKDKKKRTYTRSKNKSQREGQVVDNK